LKLARNFYSIIIILIILIVNILAADWAVSDNGEIWNRMKKENRRYFITGFLQGLDKAENIIDITVRTQQQKEFAFTEPFYVHQMRSKIRGYLPPNDQPVDLLVDLLDAFYTDQYNSKIPFEAALRIILARQSGEVEKSDLWLKEARRNVGIK
jgi:hypothetical protein